MTRVLIACEYSGVVRDAFIRRGVDAVSCDLLETESPGPHIRGPVEEVLGQDWDLIVAFPPCTHLAVSGSRFFAKKQRDGRQRAGVRFFNLFAYHGCHRVAIENPVGIMSTLYRKPDQIIQPWQHGHGETKATCLWLKNLPPLRPTDVVEGREQRIVSMLPTSLDILDPIGKYRSLTYSGVTEAMAQQWAPVVKLKWS